MTWPDGHSSSAAHVCNCFSFSPLDPLDPRWERCTRDRPMSDY